MQQIYLKRLTKQDITKSVAICSESVESFWDIDSSATDQYTPIFVCHIDNPDYFPPEITIHKGYGGEKDWRICGNEWKKLYSHDNPVVGDIMIVRKLSTRRFSVKVVNKESQAYKTLSEFFIGNDNYVILSKDITENDETESTSPLQKIYYGTPGSGKSHKVKEYLESVYPDEKEREAFVFRTTFHPDSDYASFVGCYKPKMDGDNIKYEFTPQAFTEAYVKAWQEPEKQVYLVIEEINRGNCAQIFGDLFQLLDRKGGVSEYLINADADLKQYLEKELGADNEGIANGKLKLPANLNILATMNTSDQSLFPMDSAFKRRWSWECVPIDYTNAVSSNFTITIDGKPYNWHKFLKAVNEKIVSATDSEDKQMGNFFINGDVDERHFVDKVMFYLWNDICKEEFHTKNNFFRNYVDDKKTEKEFSFNELFGSNAQTLLKGFMEYLNVSPKDEEQTNVEEEITIDSESA